MRYLLDTDTLSLVQRGHATVLSRVNRTPLADMAISTVTLWEQMQGWQSSVTRVRNRQQLAQAHERLVVRLLPTWCKFTAIVMTEPAILRFENLVTLKLNVGPMDLRIAAVALENGLIVVTRNLRDFQRVPTLNVEDWSV